MGQRKVNWFGIIVGIVGIVGSLVGAAAISNLSSAADLNSEFNSVRGHRVHRTVVLPAGCGWRCHGGCPERYTCHSLYGAYGPYGGTAYWARYTLSGWGHYR